MRSRLQRKQPMSYDSQVEEHRIPGGQARHSLAKSQSDVPKGDAGQTQNGRQQHKGCQGRKGTVALA